MAEPGLEIVVRHLRMLAPSAERVETSDQVLLERFVRRHDQAAFAALLQRHAPMIHGLCRRLLRQEADADDVFQATFLILLRKAHTIHKQPSVASWLYGVAYRIASRVRRQAIKQSPKGLEEKPSHDDPGMAAAWRELCVVLDAEVHALPERQRASVVLCYLEGRTRDQAARQLGWTLRTLERRLEQGRERLRLRLTRRGLALSTALLASALSQQTVAAVPAALCAPVQQTVGHFQIQGTLAGSQVSSRAAKLAAEGLRSIAAAKVQCIAIATLTVSMLITGSGALAFRIFLGGQTQATQQDISKPSSQVDDRPKELRQSRTDRFGDPLPEDAISRLGSTRLRHGHGIYFLRFTPDGRTLVSSAADGIGIWEVSSGKLLHFLQRGDFPGASLSADGSKLAVPFKSGIVIWDVASGKQVRTLGAVKCANTCFSPDGTILAIQTLTMDCLTELLDSVTGEAIRSWRTNQGPSSALAFTNDGKTLITAGATADTVPPRDDHDIRFWDVATGNERRFRTGTRNVSKIALSPDGTLMAGIYSPFPAKGDEAARTLVCLWEVASGKELRQLLASPTTNIPGRFDYLDALTFSHDGKSVSACLSDGTLISWDPLTGIERHRVGPDSCYSQLAFAPGGKTLATLHGLRIRLMDIASGKDLHSYAGHQRTVSSVAFAGDGRTVVTSDAERIFLWNKLNGQELREFDDRPDFLRAVRVMSDGRRLLSCEDSDQGRLITLRIRDLATGKELRRFDRRFVARKQVSVVAFAPDDSKVALGGPDDETVLVIDLITGSDLRRLQGHKSGIFGAGFTPDSGTLVVWGPYRKVRLWDVNKGQLTKEFNLAEETTHPGIPPQVGLGPGGNPYEALLSPDARTLCVGVDQLYDLATGQLIQELSSPNTEIVKAFSPDGRTLACPGHHDGAIYLLERATGRERCRFLGHRGGVQSLAFSADGRTLISGGWDTTCVVWDLTGRLTNKDCSGRPLSEKELTARWEILAGNDATTAYRAIQALAAAPAQAVPYLSQYLRPMPRVDQKHIDDLVKELESPQFAVRQRATQELEQLEELAIPGCQRALAGNPTPEVRRRLESLLATRRAKQQDLAPQHLRTLRALESLELCGTPEAARLLKALSHGAPDAWLTREAKAGVSRLASRASKAQQSDRGAR